MLLTSLVPRPNFKQLRVDYITHVTLRNVGSGYETMTVEEVSKSFR